MSDNPYQAPPGFDPGNTGGGLNRQDLLSKVAPPAIALMVVGVLNILFSLYGLVSSALFMAGVMPGADLQREQFQEMMDEGGDQAQFAEIMMQVMEVTQGPLGIVMNGIAVVVGIIILVGALKMKNMQAYGFALAGTILAMIPCVSNCCVIGLPIGIWALVILMDSDVKNAFR